MFHRNIKGIAYQYIKNHCYQGKLIFKLDIDI
jgi:hypothetical protein